MTIPSATTERVWFRPTERGQEREFSLDHIHYGWEQERERPDRRAMNVPGQTWIGGYALPPFQRDFCWTEAQQIRFIETAARGMPVGTWTYNVAPDGTQTVLDGKTYFHRTDRWLIDGQQRITTLVRFFSDAFPVFGYRWSEIPKVEQRKFLHKPFTAYELCTADETVLRETYNLMNFSGTPHREDQRA